MDFSKKCTALLLAFFLMFSNIGLAINVHFCEGEKIFSKTVYTSLVKESCDHNQDKHHHLNDKSCCESASDDHDTCCEDQIITSDNDSLVLLKAFSIDFQPFILTEQYLPEVFFYEDNLTETKALEYTFYSNAPPLYKLFCSLVLYA